MNFQATCVWPFLSDGPQSEKLLPQYLHRYSPIDERVNLVEELDNMFDHPVHLCDVKSEHFGLSVHGRAKYLDVDSVFLKPVVDKTVEEELLLT